MKQRFQWATTTLKALANAFFTIFSIPTSLTSLQATAMTGQYWLWSSMHCTLQMIYCVPLIKSTVDQRASPCVTTWRLFKTLPTASSVGAMTILHKLLICMNMQGLGTRWVYDTAAIDLTFEKCELQAYTVYASEIAFSQSSKAYSMNLMIWGSISTFHLHENSCICQWKHEKGLILSTSYNKLHIEEFFFVKYAGLLRKCDLCQKTDSTIQYYFTTSLKWLQMTTDIY